MIKTPGKVEDYKGSDPSHSPTAQNDGVFSSCSGGVPLRGAFARIPGKSLRNSGLGVGAAISIFQFGQKVVVQRFSGIEIFEIVELAPNPSDFVYDNEENLVRDNEGIPITT